MSRSVPWSGWWPYVGRCCSCGARVTQASFRDAQSWSVYAHADPRLCQACQDDLYFRASLANPSRRYPLRRGVLAAPLQRECGLELGVLPFKFVAPEARVAWESRYLLRAGAAIEVLDPWRELDVMHPALVTHQVRLRQFDGLSVPEVRAAFDVDMVVVFDESASLALDRFPFAVTGLRVVLELDLPWGLLYGSPLRVLLRAWCGGVAGSSVLRTCGLLGFALEPMGADSFFPLAYVLSSNPERFPEIGWSSPDVSP